MGAYDINFTPGYRITYAVMVSWSTRFREEQRWFEVDGTVYRWYVTAAQYK
jgi:hypothetical protein